ncbi:hypothetical protein JZK55_01420 [Dissulfurispira thermophila]|uniref:Uncharacterized protein n=2 Tax=root TaxID=1 RepID=A0A7G1GXX6_9BACT|nr:hypothetical protein [Dissulfurispira thermophila]BCB95220.1 hypothetical protein JZK55_01420 [Dissulfurispira thermophila]
MILKTLCISLTICIVTLFSTTINAQLDAPYFSNEDIEKYKSHSDNKMSETKARTAGSPESRRLSGMRIETKEKAEKTRGHKEKEYWCKRATFYKNKIERAESEIAAAEGKLTELKEAALRETGKKRRIIEADIKKIEKKLKEIKRKRKENEKDLNRLEDEAHRKNIPSGWLRCQFDW